MLKAYDVNEASREGVMFIKVAVRLKQWLFLRGIDFIVKV